MNRQRTRFQVLVIPWLILSGFCYCLSGERGRTDLFLESVPLENLGHDPLEKRPARKLDPRTATNISRYTDTTGRIHYVNYDNFIPARYRNQADSNIALPPLNRGEYQIPKPKKDQGTLALPGVGVVKKTLHSAARRLSAPGADSKNTPPRNSKKNKAGDDNALTLLDPQSLQDGLQRLNELLGAGKNE